jgi:hypothetical protein
MSDNYDVQQVCENGHQITDCYNISPEKQKRFCQECGAATIIACPGCGERIQGAQIGVSQDYTGGRTGQKIIPKVHADVPPHCHNCGEPYPWTKSKIMTAIQILTEFGELNGQEKKTIEQDVNNIARDVPQTELSAMRIKRILGKCGGAAHEIIMEFASRTAAKVLKNP